MAHYIGRITSPITAKPEAISSSGFLPGNDEGLANVRSWKRFLAWDIGIRIGGNIITTLLMCLLALCVAVSQGASATKTTNSPWCRAGSLK